MTVTTYKREPEGLVHGANLYVRPPKASLKHVVDTWCGSLYVIDGDAGCRVDQVVTCLPCLVRHMKHMQARAAELAVYKTDIRQILADNSVKDMQLLEDQKYLDAVEAEIAKTSAE